MKYIVMMAILLPGLLLSEITIAVSFWGLPDPNLKHIAGIRKDQADGYAVTYNPDLCQRVGAACGFFAKHEQAHGQLRHPTGVSPESYPTSYEAEADCWAAKNGKSHEVYAAVQLFLEDGNNPDWNILGDPAERAERIRTCATQAGNWIENQ